MTTMCRYRWLKREGMTERGVEPCGDCPDCEAAPPPPPPRAPRQRTAKPAQRAKATGGPETGPDPA